MKIFLDPGHGGNDPGAVGLAGTRESAIALRVALTTERYLVAAGHTVAISRDFDVETVGLSDRAHLANEWDAEALVSIHCNAADDRTAHGYEVWTTPGQTGADPLAQALFISMGRAFPSEPARKDRSDGDDDKEAKFAVLRLTKAPACLVELGFISHLPTEAAMQSPSWIASAAGAIAVGIDAWIKRITP